MSLNVSQPRRSTIYRFISETGFGLNNALGMVSASVRNPLKSAGLKTTVPRNSTDHQCGLREGLIESPGPKGPLQPGFPEKILEVYFPQLVVDLPADLSDRVGR
jgi:hypothetical protein